MDRNGVNNIRCAPYHPSSNGAVERFVQTFKTVMKAEKNDPQPFQQFLDSFLLSYQSTPHATTNQAPSVLFLQRHLQTRLDLLKPEVESQVLKKQSDQTFHHDQHVKHRDFSIGQHVMVINFCSGPAWLLGKVVKVLGPVSYLAHVGNYVAWKHHVGRELNSYEVDSYELDIYLACVLIE